MGRSAQLEIYDIDWDPRAYVDSPLRKGEGIWSSLYYLRALLFDEDFAATFFTVRFNAVLPLAAAFLTIFLAAAFPFDFAGTGFTSVRICSCM